jgi:hypothetical protein
MTPEEFDLAKNLVDAELDPAKKEELGEILRDLPDKFQEFHAARPKKVTTDEKALHREQELDLGELFGSKKWAIGEATLDYKGTFYKE